MKPPIFPSTVKECHEEIGLIYADLESYQSLVVTLREEIARLQDELDEVKLDRDYQEGEILDLRRDLDAAYRVEDYKYDQGVTHGEGNYYDPED
jgi:hypothetical protein